MSAPIVVSIPLVGLPALGPADTDEVLLAACRAFASGEQTRRGNSWRWATGRLSAAQLAAFAAWVEAAPEPETYSERFGRQALLAQVEAALIRI